ncbi:MAG: FliH/SctL family protein, partial [Bacilli bacterium]
MFKAPKKETDGVFQLRPVMFNQEEEQTNQTEKVDLSTIKAQSEQLMNHARQQYDELLLRAEQVKHQAFEEAQAEKAAVEAWAKTIRDEIEEERKVVYLEAEQQGYQAGFQQGETEALHQYAQILDEARIVVDNAREDYKKILKSADETLISMAFAITEKVLGEKVSSAPETLQSLIEQEVRAHVDKGDVRITVHPDVYENIVSRRDEWEQLLQSRGTLYIYPDP